MVEPVQNRSSNLELLLKQSHRLLLRDSRLTAVALGVVGERTLQALGDSYVVDDQPALLLPEYPVHPGNRLHQAMAAHRLVDIHRVQRRSVETGKPHVAHYDQPQRIVGVAKSRLDLFHALRIADVSLPMEVVR